MKKHWKNLKNHEADIIITDVMMPVMDGIKLCKNIKQNIRTCHNSGYHTCLPKPT